MQVNAVLGILVLASCFIPNHSLNISSLQRAMQLQEEWVRDGGQCL